MGDANIDWIAVGAVIGPVVALTVGVWTQRRAQKSDKKTYHQKQTDSAIEAVRLLNEALKDEVDRLSEELRKKDEDL